jgi:hypothetical protein
VTAAIVLILGLTAPPAPCGVGDFLSVRFERSVKENPAAMSGRA